MIDTNNVISATLSKPTLSVTQSPTTSAINAFQTLYEKCIDPPEALAVHTVQTINKSYSNKMQEIRRAVENFSDPQTGLLVQKKITEAMVTMDLCAKFAGVVSQGVNKLVMIQ